jgi:hypothetical protein
MELPDESPASTNLKKRGEFPSRGWGFLDRAMTALGILFLMAGFFLLVVLLWLISLSRSWDWVLLLVFGWALVPLISGFLLVHASERIAKPSRSSGRFLILVAATTFTGLGWAAFTAAIILNWSSIINQFFRVSFP